MKTGTSIWREGNANRVNPPIERLDQWIQIKNKSRPVVQEQAEHLHLDLVILRCKLALSMNRVEYG